ncbi:hypothetical protein M1857_12545 [Lactiplantibacillus plantarum]|nr:hypothetical protein M1857_12545 [Lactiplantibacillus plantarum]
MPALSLIKRDYTQVYDKYIALGPNARGKEGGLGSVMMSRLNTMSLRIF